jgi:hypothetical protein
VADCTSVQYGELRPTFQKVHRSTSEYVSVSFSQSYVSARPTFSPFSVSATGLTSRSRSSSSTQPIWIGIEALRSRAGGLYSGPYGELWSTFEKVQNHVGGRLCCFLPPYVSATPIFSTFLFFFSTATTTRSHYSSSTEPICIGFRTINGVKGG